MQKHKDNTTQMFDSFVDEYNSNDAILKYSKHTAGYGINYLLRKDYANRYLKVIKSNGFLLKGSGLRLLEFGCGAGMNLINLVRTLRTQGIEVEKAYGTDFSPVLIESAGREAKESLLPGDLGRVGFYVARNETLLDDLSKASGKAVPELLETFDFRCKYISVLPQIGKIRRVCHRHLQAVEEGWSLHHDRHESKISSFSKQVKAVGGGSG